MQSDNIKLIDQVLDAYSSHNKSVKFIQIGSNDGVTGDPLRKFIQRNNWKGIMVEPVAYIFQKLQKNYANYSKNIIFENTAVSENGKRKKFYRLAENHHTGLPDWYDQIGSFCREVVITHEFAIPNIRQLIIEEEIETITFRDLIANHSFYDVNLIHIDTEGYDFEILKLIDFSLLEIEVIVYEHKHLSYTDYQLSQKLLLEQNFSLFAQWNDTVAMAPSFVKVLETSPYWRSLAALSLTT